MNKENEEIYFERVDARLKKLSKEYGGLPRRISFATYINDEALAFFRPNENWPGGAAEHRSFVLGVVAKLAKKYPEVEFFLRDIDMAKYFAFLTEKGLIDGPETRAMFVGQGED